MPPTYAACPTEIVEAPIEVVWKLLTNFAGWGSFYDVRVIRVEPPGTAAIGQRMLGEAGPRWLHLGVSFQYTVIDKPHHKLEFDGKLPFGMTVHEMLDCIPLDVGRCRINYHCNFAFAEGWRGSILRFLLRRGLKEGPADSLKRLKRAAEQSHRVEAARIISAK